MLKMIRLFKLTLKIFKTNNNKVVEVSSNTTNEIVKNLSKFKNLRNTMFKITIYIRALKKLIFLIINTKIVLDYLI